jgi:hypothetical protein
MKTKELGYVPSKSDQPFLIDLIGHLGIYKE